MNPRHNSLSLLFLLSGVGVLMTVTASWADDKQNDSPQAAPQGAKVLFDGKDLSGWVKRDGKQSAAWKIEDGYMEVHGGDIMTRQKYGPDFRLHVEFWLPLMEKATGQGRANSGVYLQGRYEIQVLDSYKNKTYDDGSVGAMYQILTPNKEAQQKAVKPPEQWNAYDITFRAPRVDDKGKVMEKGRVTVVLNGVTLIDDGAFDHVTGGAMNNKLGEPGPLLLQDHGCKVRYRNIWIEPLSTEVKK